MFIGLAPLSCVPVKNTTKHDFCPQSRDDLYTRVASCGQKVPNDVTTKFESVRHSLPACSVLRVELDSYVETLELFITLSSK